MKVYLSTWSLHRLFFERAIGILSMPGLGRSLGFDGVELEDIWFESSTPEFLRRLRREAKKHRMGISIAISNDFTVKGRRKFLEQTGHVEKFLYLAKSFRQDVVRILMGSARADRVSLQQVKEGIGRAVECAEELGMKLALENHDRLSRKPETMLEVLKNFRPSQIGICLDFGNLDSRRRYDAIRRLAPRTLLVHAKSYHFRPDGEETRISYKRSFSLLRRSGYRGVVVVEYDGPGDQLLGSVTTLALVRKHWSAE